MDPNDVMIMWIGPDSDEDPIMNDGRLMISDVMDSGNNMYTRSLQFGHLRMEDSGTYSCDVMILDASGTASVVIGNISRQCIVYNVICILNIHRVMHVLYLSVTLYVF